MNELEWISKFSRKLEDIMSEESMTQIDLARETGLSAGAINSYVNGTKMPGIKAILRLAYVLNRDVRELIDFGSDID